jgi:PPM family protein phosphatase
MPNTVLENLPTEDERPPSADGSLAAVATISSKAVNQDAAAVLENTEIPCKGVVVTDGLGSHYGAELAATQTVELFRASVARCSLNSGVDICAICAEAVRMLRAYIDDHASTLPEHLDVTNAFGTTMLIALNEPTRLQLGYVGNGAMIHLRGDFTEFPDRQLLPWSAINYLNPHSISRNGRNILYKFLSPTVSTEQSTPTVLTLTKDLAFVGDIVLVCSDGISSYDQTRIGADAEGNIWINGEPSLKDFYCWSAGQTQADRNSTRFRISSAVTVLINRMSRRSSSPARYRCCGATTIPACDRCSAIHA